MIALLGLLTLPFTAADLVKIDCSRAAAHATHTTDADEYHVRHIIDGDLTNNSKEIFLGAPPPEDFACRSHFDLAP